MSTAALPDTPPGGEAAPDVILRAENINKRFGAVVALRGVNMHLNRGEVLGLVGDNGAGKSTLVKILSGFQRPDTGRIFVEGHEVTFHSVKEARAHGIETVYQDLALIPQLTVYENLSSTAKSRSWAGSASCPGGACGRSLANTSTTSR